MAIPNADLGEIATTTIDRYSATLADNVLTHNAFLSRLQQRGNTKSVSGGKRILENLMYDENSTFELRV